MSGSLIAELPKLKPTQLVNRKVGKWATVGFQDEAGTVAVKTSKSASMTRAKTVLHPPNGKDPTQQYADILFDMWSREWETSGNDQILGNGLVTLVIPGHPLNLEVLLQSKTELRQKIQSAPIVSDGVYYFQHPFEGPVRLDFLFDVLDCGLATRLYALYLLHGSKMGVFLGGKDASPGTILKDWMIRPEVLNSEVHKILEAHSLSFPAHFNIKTNEHFVGF